MTTDEREKQREYHRTYRQRHPERVKEAQRKWRAANPGRRRESDEQYRDKHGREAVALSRNHGLSLKDAQDVIGRKPRACEICGETGKRLCYDHDHSTMHHRGWLCNYCNVSLKVVESPVRLAAAQAYLSQRRS